MQVMLESTIYFNNETQFFLGKRSYEEFIVYRRRTDNTMAKRKRTKGQTTIYKLTYKTKNRVTRTPLKPEG